MKAFSLLCILSLVLAGAGSSQSFKTSVAIDFEEEPVPDLSKISNVYHGTARYIYAFLIVRGCEGNKLGAYVSAYDLGYKLICPDSSVINHGFYRLSHWKSLSAQETDFPTELNLPGARVPTAIGYWKLELKNGSRSRAEFQLVPNPLNGQLAITLADSGGNAFTLAHNELSQDVTCHGVINRTFYANEPYRIGDLGYVPGEIIARFMPSVIEMSGRFGDIGDIVDPGLKAVARHFGLITITRRYRSATRNPAPILSRTGKLFKPIDRWDVYVLKFPDSIDMFEALNAILALPRCVYAYPNEFARLTSCTHVPNDSLAPDSWHLYRIGMPCAWDQEIGDTTVHIGVIDGGVDFHLADFDSGYGPGHKIAGGKDFANYDPPDTLPDIKYGDDCTDCNHGNFMTSTVGAITNNETGAAGAAGGWGGPEGELGPSIFHFKIRKDFGPYYGSLIDEALLEGCSSRYQCDVPSLSVRGSYTADLKEAVRDCYYSGTVLAATLDNAEPDYDWVYAPSCLRNDWILCAQGSSRHPDSLGDPIPERRVSSKDPSYTWGANWPLPNWPIPVLATDVSAPAVQMCIIWGDSLGDEKPVYRCNGSGVSYAPPQVAGLAALMLAKDNTLSVRDIEGLISASCTDITSDWEEAGDLPGWDKYTGWGRINADTCLMFLDPNHPCEFEILHLVESGGGVVVDSQATADTITFIGNGSLSGSYRTRRFEVRRAVTPPSGYRFLWATHHDSAGWGWSGDVTTWYRDIYNLQEPYCDLVPTTQYAPTCTLFTYAYKVWTLIGGEYLGWYPAQPQLLDWAYAALYQGIPASVRASRDGVLADRLRIVSAAPSPSKGEVLISFELPVSRRVTVKVYNVRGREVRTILDEKKEAGTHNTKWDGRNNSGRYVVPGVYMCRVNTGDQYDVKKMLLLREGGK